MDARSTKARYEYPYNFLAAAYSLEDEQVSKLYGYKTEAAFYQIMSELPSRTATIIAMYYKHKMTQQEIADDLGISHGRVGQIIRRALSTFNTVKWRDLIEIGINEYYAKIRLETSDSKYKSGYVAGYSDGVRDRANRVQNPTIDCMDLSVRLHNCLKRGGYETLNDIMEAKVEDILKLRNFGEVCLCELIIKIKACGRDASKFINYVKENNHE